MYWALFHFHYLVYYLLSKEYTVVFVINSLYISFLDAVWGRLFFLLLLTPPL